MPFHADLPYLVLRMKEANRIMQFAMRRSAEDYYNEINRPTLHTLSETAGRFTAAEFSNEYDEESFAVDLFATGIHDIIPPFVAIADNTPELTKEKSLSLMRSSQTIATYGLLASMPQAGLARVNESAPEYFTLSDDTSSIILTQPIRSSPNYGCEAVDARSGSPEMSPLFKKFVPWAGSIAVLAYFEHK